MTKKRNLKDSEKELLKSITIRVPIDLWDRVEDEAKRQERSINGQAVYIMKKYFSDLDGGKAE